MIDTRILIEQSISSHMHIWVSLITSSSLRTEAGKRVSMDDYGVIGQIDKRLYCIEYLQATSVKNTPKISKQVPQNHCQRILVRHQWPQRTIC